jgi:hypothetical protein
MGFGSCPMKSHGIGISHGTDPTGFPVGYPTGYPIGLEDWGIGGLGASPPRNLFWLPHIGASKLGTQCCVSPQLPRLNPPYMFPFVYLGQWSEVCGHSCGL